MAPSNMITATFALLLSSRARADDYNDALAESVLVNSANLVDLPWGNALNILDAAFNSVYSDHELVTGGINQTRPLLWQIFKPFNDVADGGATLDGIYMGFENGEFLWYYAEDSDKQPGTFVYVSSRNASCPLFGLNNTCLLFYDNTTDPVTGGVAGTASAGVSFDPTVRPWYISSLESKSPSWTDPYVFVGAGDPELGISAARPIVTADEEYLGVFGVDFLLSTMDTLLASAVTDDSVYVIYIIDDQGLLISTSISGASVNSETNTQVVANQSSVSIIASATKAIDARVVSVDGRNWTSIDGQLITFQDEVSREVYYAMSLELDDAYGRRPWYIVTVERVRCAKGYYSPANLGNPSAASSLTCKACPEGASCAGDRALPESKQGFWGDTSNNGTYLTEFYAVGACAAVILPVDCALFFPS